MKKKIGIFWLRDDFRIAKNLALAYATKNHNRVVVLYLFKEKNMPIKKHRNGGSTNL